MTEAEDRHIVTRAQAKRLGLKRYFTGKPCKRGHIAEHWISGPCVVCQRERGNQWHAENRDKVNAGAKRRYEANPEKARAKKREWRLDNPEKAREADRRFREKHPEKARAAVRAAWAKNKNNYEAGIRRWQAENVEKFRAYREKWKAAHPDQHEAALEKWRKENPDFLRASRAQRRARVRNAEGRYTASDLKEIFQRQNGRCVYCRQELGKKYHADHIVALARGGSNWPSNIQLLCPSCNCTKGAKGHDEVAALLCEAIDAPSQLSRRHIGEGLEN
jgi:5-methylcytosine-specific restriction endonuclease McrA